MESEGKAKRRKSVGSIHFKLKFRPDKRRVDVKQKSRKLFTNEKEANVRRGRRTDDRANKLRRFVKQSRHRQIRDREDSSFCGAGGNRKHEHLAGVSFRFIVEAISVRRFIRYTCALVLRDIEKGMDDVDGPMTLAER